MPTTRDVQLATTPRPLADSSTKKNRQNRAGCASSPPKMSQNDQIERLYDEHAQAVFGFLLNFTHNEQDTRDLMQDLFVKLASRPELLKGVRQERAFLLRLAANLAIDLSRRRGTRHRNHNEFSFTNESIFEDATSCDEQEFRAALEAALGELPPEQRATVHLKLWGGFTFDAISEMLGVSLNTAASRYRYAIDKLQRRLRPLYEEIK
jgi:RNA polymerase sigma-70 factor (ECF subfamily)